MRRITRGAAVFAMAIMLVLSQSACTAGDEAIAILNGTLPVVQGVGAVVALADPALSPVITAGIAGYTAAIGVATTAYNNWKTAVASAQPSKLADFEAAMAAVKTSLNQILTVAHVTDPAKQNSIDLLFSAAMSAITEVITLTEQVKSLGGTTADLDLVLHHEQWGGGKAPAPAQTKALKFAKPTINQKHMASDLKKRLLVKTGDTQLDAVRASIAAKL